MAQALEEVGLLEGLPKIVAAEGLPNRRTATEQEILLCHTPDYLETVKRDVADGARALSTGDTMISEKSYEVAREVGVSLSEACSKLLTPSSRVGPQTHFA